MKEKNNYSITNATPSQYSNNPTKSDKKDLFYSFVPGAYGKDKLSIDEVGRTIKCMHLFPSYKDCNYDDVFHHSPQGIYAQRWDMDETKNGEIETIFEFPKDNKNVNTLEAEHTVIGNFIIEGRIYNNNVQYPSILALLHDANINDESSYGSFRPAKKIARLHESSLFDIVLTAEEDEIFWQLLLKGSSLYVIASNTDYSKWFLLVYNIDTEECATKLLLPDTLQAQPKLPVCIVDIYDSLYIAIPNSTNRVIVVPTENSPLGDEIFSFCPYDNNYVFDYAGGKNGLSLIGYSPLLNISYGYKGLHYVFPKYTGLLRTNDRSKFEEKIMSSRLRPITPPPADYIFSTGRKIFTIENPYEDRYLKYTYALINSNEPGATESAYTSSGVLFWNSSETIPINFPDATKLSKDTSPINTDMQVNVSFVPYYLCHFADEAPQWNYAPYSLFDVIYPLPAANPDTNLDDIFKDIDGAVLDRTGRLYVRGPTALNTIPNKTPVLTSLKPLSMLVKAPSIPIKKGILPFTAGDFPTSGRVTPLMVWKDWLGWPHHIMPVSISLPDGIEVSTKPGKDKFPRQAHLRSGSVLDVGQNGTATWGLYGNDGYGVFNDWPNIHFQFNDYLMPEDGYYSFPVLCLPYAGGIDGYGSGLEPSTSGFNVLFMRDARGNKPYYPSHIYWPRNKDYRIVFTPKFNAGTTFTFHDGSLPEGVTLSEDGVLSGKTSDEMLSVYTFSVDVHNDEYGQPNGNSGTIYITIVADEEPIMVPEELHLQPRINESYSHTFLSNPVARLYRLADNYNVIPDGLNFDSNTGVLDGKISADALVQEYTFAIQASSDGISWGPAQRYELTVLPALVPDVPDQSIDILVGSVYTGLKIEASEQADAFVLAENTMHNVIVPGDGIPLGFTIDLDNGTINGQIIPNSVADGVYQFSIAALNQNGVGQFGTISLVIQEQDPPVMQPQDLSQAYPGEDYRVVFNVLNNFTGIKFDTRVKQGQLDPSEDEYRVPKGIIISESENNVISGTLDKKVSPGIYEFLIQAYVYIDSFQAEGSPQEYKLEVMPSRFPEIISAEYLDFTKGEYSSYQLQASNNPTYFVLYEGILPEGITLTPSGLLSGLTSSHSGEYAIKIQAKNDTQGYGPEKQMVINVHETPLLNMQPTYTPNEPLIVDNECIYYFSAEGTASLYQFSEETSSSIIPGENVYPEGLTPTQEIVDGRLTQLLSGKPISDVKTGDYSLSIQAINALNNPGDPQVYTLPVIGYPVWTGYNITHTVAKGEHVLILLDSSTEDSAAALESQKDYAALTVDWAGAHPETSAGQPNTYPMGLQLLCTNGKWRIEGIIDPQCDIGRYKCKLVASNIATRKNDYASPPGSLYNGVSSAMFYFTVS